ncbi:unnamed protein product [Rotaria sordida]|uniref:Uncharacterized protein n=1 Tax=Rotaria sordida TaxID=392033 RepID=A0A815Y7D3_9BILA|nr:unnamed protein product [Rotaria sordida]CAF1566517.1 unnamed protein product [Rotaria sordida]
MECILLVTSYPNLTELKIFNCQRDNSLDYFTEYLNIIETSICAYPDLSIRYLSSNIFSSSILTYLSINVGTLTDCIYLLDGRLKQLNTFIIRIYQMDLDSSIVHNLDDLPNLKCFSLIHYGLIEEYNNINKYLLHRMLYLEKLTLYLRIACQPVFIDPISIINQFSMHMSQLNSFKFYLKSTENNRNVMVRYLSNNNIKRYNNNKEYKDLSDIICYTSNIATYHIFTLPFEFAVLMSIGNIYMYSGYVQKIK